MHGRQRRCQENCVSLPSGRLEKTTRSSPHHVAQHRPTGSETTPPYAPTSSRFGSEPPSAEDDVDVWRYAILSCMPETTTTVYIYDCSRKTFSYIYCNINEVSVDYSYEWYATVLSHTKTHAVRLRPKQHSLHSHRTIAKRAQQHVNGTPYNVQTQRKVIPSGV